MRSITIKYAELIDSVMSEIINQGDKQKAIDLLGMDDKELYIFLDDEQQRLDKELDQQIAQTQTVLDILQAKSGIIKSK
jgi:hypothetical protein